MILGQPTRAEVHLWTLFQRSISDLADDWEDESHEWRYGTPEHPEPNVKRADYVWGWRQAVVTFANRAPWGEYMTAS